MKKPKQFDPFISKDFLLWIGLILALLGVFAQYKIWQEQKRLEPPSPEKLYCRDLTITKKGRLIPGLYEFCTSDPNSIMFK